MLIPHQPSRQGQKSGQLYSPTLLFFTLVYHLCGQQETDLQKTGDTEPVVKLKTNWVLRKQIPFLRLFTRLLAMRERILNTWCSFCCYAVSFLFPFSHEKWVREIQFCLQFILILNSEESTSGIQACNPFHCFTWVSWFC